MSYSGSSPLARGTSSALPAAHTYPRLIPARAGNISLRVNPFAAATAHPRSRGEHQKALGDTATVDGSSPLARGTSLRKHPAVIRDRLIPARAGNIRAGRVLDLRSAAHPRSRGEHVAAALATVPTGGSSPLARGTCESFCNSSIFSRLIPARAGNIPQQKDRQIMFTAHPRSRGEHQAVLLLFLGVFGSSPLARGTCPVWAVPDVRPRLIPARAGNIRTRS